MHISLDLETLDITATAVVLSIGVVAFTTGGIVDELELSPSIDEQLREGRTINESTILWWLGREEEARRKIIDTKRISLSSALGQLSDFIKRIEPLEGVWGNGSDFDNAILIHLYKGLPPWSFWLSRCLRTLKEYNPVVLAHRTSTLHSALDDAEYQAGIVMAILRSKEC